MWEVLLMLGDGQVDSQAWQENLHCEEISDCVLTTSQFLGFWDRSLVSVKTQKFTDSTGKFATSL